MENIYGKYSNINQSRPCRAGLASHSFGQIFREDLGMPFMVMSEYELYEYKDNPFVKVVWRDFKHPRNIYAVKSQAYPLAWVQWWVIFRIEKSRRLTEACILHILNTWHLYTPIPGVIPSLRDLWSRRGKTRG